MYFKKTCSCLLAVLLFQASIPWSSFAQAGKIAPISKSEAPRLSFTALPPADQIQFALDMRNLLSQLPMQSSQPSMASQELISFFDRQRSAPNATPLQKAVINTLSGVVCSGDFLGPVVKDLKNIDSNNQYPGIGSELATSLAHFERHYRSVRSLLAQDGSFDISGSWYHVFDGVGEIRQLHLGTVVLVASNSTRAPPRLARATPHEPTASPSIPIPNAPQAPTRLANDKPRLEVLQLPNGKIIRVQVPKTESERTYGLMFREILPEDGMLEKSNEEADLLLWQKNILIPLDYVILNTQGMIVDILRRVPPSLPQTPWGAVPLLETHGRHVLALPAGKADEYGLTKNKNIRSLNSDWNEKSRSVTSLAYDVLQNERGGAERVMQYFADRPEEYNTFDSVLMRLNHQIQQVDQSQAQEQARNWQNAKERLYATALKDEKFQSFRLQGILAWHDLHLWTKNAPLSAILIANSNAFYLPFVFIHELGHYLAAKTLGLKVLKFRVFRTGGGYIQREDAIQNWKNFVVSVAGPLLEFIAAFNLVGIAILILARHYPAFPHFWLQWTQERGLSLQNPLALPFSLILTPFALNILQGGIYDWANSALALGWTRLSHEINWRLTTHAFANPLLLLEQLLIKEAFGIRTPGPWVDKLQAQLASGGIDKKILIK